MEKKYLDQQGVQYLWSKVNMQDYPNNDTLMAVINAIDETKADKKDIVILPETQKTHQYLVTNNNGEKIWEDKLAFTYPEYTIIHEGFTMPEGKKMLYASIPDVLVPIQEGCEYTVVWDDVSYTCLAETKLDNFGTALGNPALISTQYSDLDNGLPFFFVGLFQHNMASIVWGADDTGHTCSQIYGTNIIYTSIDGRHIAGGIFRGTGDQSTVIGQGYATGRNSIALNSATTEGDDSCAEGFGTVHAGVTWGHAEGGYTNVFGNMGHAEGYGTTSYGTAQHTQGKCNIHDEECKYAHIVGNGSGGSVESRSNAHTLDWNGNAKFAGDVYVNGTGAQDLIDAKKVATEEYVDTRVNELFQNVSNGKELIASAITDKGVYASDDETFQELSDKISLIPVGPPGSNIIGYIDEENDIYVSLSDLEDGIYTLKFEDYNGLLDNFDDIGTLEVSE